jgi:hypothetical protein
VETKIKSPLIKIIVNLIYKLKQKQNMKRDFRILTSLRGEIGNLLYKEKNKSVADLKSRGAVTFKGNDKNHLFPLSLFAKKGSFLNQQTYDYLNSVSPKNMRCWTPSPSTISSNTNVHNTKLFNFILKYNEQRAIKTSRGTENDVLYQYLKSFSIFNNRKNGIFLQYNQYIGYNFNSNNILLPFGKNKNQQLLPLQEQRPKGQGRGVDTQSNKSLIFYNNTSSLFRNSASAFKYNMSSPLLRELNRFKGVSDASALLRGNNRSANNRIINYSYKLLFYFFKSMYCLISKPVFLFTPDKVTIQLFYFLNIPKFKVFKWYSILNNKFIRPSDNIPNPKPRGQGQKDYSYLNKLNVDPVSNNINKNQSVAGALKYISNKEMMNRLKLSWRIKKTLFRLNKKRNKVKNILFNLNKFNLFKVFSLKFKLICGILSNKFKKPVELQLIRIHQPFYDSNILVNLLSLNIKNKKFKPNVAIEKLYAKKAVKNLYDYSNKSVNVIPSFLSGIKIRIGGRLMREPIIPRITTKNFERGASSPGKVNFLDTATITNKNRKGSYSIKISSGQNFF